MSFTSDKKGLSILMMVALIIFFGILASMAFTVWQQFGAATTGEACKKLCGGKPKKAKKKGCWCGTDKVEGRYLHLSVNPQSSPSSRSKVYAFHLTHLPLPDLSDYKKEENANLKDGCDGSANLQNWHTQAKNTDGCEVYVVDKGNGGCTLYNVDEGEELDGGVGNSLDDEFAGVSGEINSTGTEDVWNSLAFGDDIQLEYRDLAGQKHLLEYPYGDGNGVTEFLLWRDVKCVQRGGEYEWEVQRD